MVPLWMLVVSGTLLSAGAMAHRPTDAAALPRMAAGAFAQVSAAAESERLARVEQWLKALLDHDPGITDQSAKTVASWSRDELKTLWLDLSVLIRLMRNPGLRSFNWRLPGDPKPTAIRYSNAALDRLRALACAAAGTVRSARCAAIGAVRTLDADLLELAIRAADAGLDDGDNFILRRGALLHADIAMLLPHLAPDAGGPGTIESYRVTMSDGQQTEVRSQTGHWDIGRALVAFVLPAPGRDDMVRQWYVATATWMQDIGDYETVHLERARELFPADADVLFLSGCLHEVFASAPVQAVARAARLPSGMTIAVESEDRELRQAEALFRKSLEADPAQPEARVRLGRVLSRLNRHADAARELRLALSSTTDRLLLYYASMFLGAADEALERYDEAQASFERAASLYDTAQSPRLALSELARRRGDRTTALREMQQVFSLPVSQFERHDPWWDYDKAQARHLGDRLRALRRPFLDGSVR